MFLLAVTAAHVRLLLRIFAAFHADASFLSPLVAAALKRKVGFIGPGPLSSILTFAQQNRLPTSREIVKLKTGQP